MAQRATLRTDTGRELRVEILQEHVEGGEIVVRRIDADDSPTADLLTVVDAHLTVAASYPAGTTDRILGVDQEGGAAPVDIYGTAWGRVLEGIDPAVLVVSDTPSIEAPDGIPAVE